MKPIDAERTINEELYRNPVTRPTITIDCNTIKWKHEPPVIANKIYECIVRINSEFPDCLRGPSIFDNHVDCRGFACWRGEKIDAADFMKKSVSSWHTKQNVLQICS